MEQQFPALSDERIARLGAGWDHELYSVGEDWILRFPKRAERVPWLLREIEIMELVAGALKHLVARFELRGRPGSGCPYPFVGYRRLIGICADQTGHVSRALPADIGQALSRLHRVSVDQIPPTPVGGEPDSWDQLATQLQSVATVVQPLLSEDLLARARPYLNGRRQPPPRREEQRAIHNDICPEHLIVAPRSGRLTGIIDFSDATVGDPALDMVGLIGLGGYRSSPTSCPPMTSSWARTSRTR